jgi:saccharopine dehydrogenase-like NADP-dependent oxidoreductase
VEACVRVLVVGAGGVGAAAARIAMRRKFVEAMVLADLDGARAGRAAADTASDRVRPATVDASDSAAVAELIRTSRADAVLNACDPRYVMPVFDACLTAGVTYLDMAMSLSRPHPQRPYELPGIKLGDEQFAAAGAWERRGQLALVGMGVEPGLSDVFARYAADHLFAEIDEVGVRDGANLVILGPDGRPTFAPTFSVWTTIEECLNPPVIWERDRGWFTTEPFSEPETFDFPAGIGPLECVNVEHEEVLLVPRWVNARRVTFKYGLGAEFIEVLQVLHKLGLDRTDPVQVRGTAVAPRDVVAACLPDPAELGDRMRGRTCAGTWVTGTGPDGQPREVYLHHVVDNETSTREYGTQAVVWQTAVNPIIALELLDSGGWAGIGVLGPEAFDPVPFLDALADYGTPWRLREQPAGGRAAGVAGMARATPAGTAEAPVAAGESAGGGAP